MRVLGEQLRESYSRRIIGWKKTLIILAVILACTAIASLNIGFSRIPFQKIIAVFLQVLPNSSQFLPEPSPAETVILLQVRLPRILAGILVGIALSAGGVVFQAIFRNPMADPYVLGVSSGAALGGVVAIAFGFGAILFGAFVVPAMAFSGAALASIAVYRLARTRGATPAMALLLSGVAISVVLSSLVTLTLFLANPYNQLQAIVFWLIGSLASMSWAEVIVTAPLILIPAILLNFFARDLNIMLLGEEEAVHLGVSPESLKKVVLLLTSLGVASAVAISGIIGFVGLIVPHIMRLVVGPDHRILLPASMLTGAIYLVTFDAVSRVIYLPSELPVGVVTALVGGPFFLYLLQRKKGSYRI
ncbi:MAG: iron chelate uptake ABC transporter family permease subunit [Thaumarchaeota archaeon]|nr:iron chelate uptake ABC transporter family permease subunit [Nitrososphaerota archaeon]